MENSLLAPCNTVTYDVRELKFNQDPYALWIPDNLAESNNDTEIDDYYEDANDVDPDLDGSRNLSIRSTNHQLSRPRHIFVYYSTTDETTITSELLIDLPSFISAIGGNLGLFLGFSFMGVIFSFYNMLKSHIHWNGRGLDQKRAKCLA